MIAYHFPPLVGSSGIQRTLRFAGHLPKFGWNPIVLTTHPRAYEQVSDDLAHEVPEGLEVIRAPAWDAARHLSIYQCYPGLLARPDRWMSWWLGAMPKGLAAIRRHHPHAIWSTYPIATAHRIGHSLAKYSKLPWIADFRDPMAQDDYPTDPAQWRSFLRIERATVARADLSIFTAPGAAALYRQRYPEHIERIQVIENGYDEGALSAECAFAPLIPGKLTLLHSGIVYPSERDPSRLMQALARLQRETPDLFDRLSIRFRAPVHDELLHECAGRFGVARAIDVQPPVNYRQALAEMHSADGLLILQASNCNQQIPAKFYEYLACRRPLLALTDPAGDTAQAVRASGVDAIAPLDDTPAIAAILRRFLTNPQALNRPTEQAIAGASRRARTAQLAACLDRVSATHRHCDT
jgi:glycosyltransferase involved in cell wall biosynthesis